MFTPVVHNFDLVRGSTLRKTFLWKDAAGVLVPLNGYGGVCNLKLDRSKLTDPAALELTVNSGGVILLTPGSITIYAPPDAFRLLTADSYAYNLHLSDPSGDVFPFASGKITLVPSTVI